MGSKSGVICKDCSTKYNMFKGGGFRFHLLHCDICGKEKQVSFRELGDIHLRYIKGLNVPYCMATNESDKFIQENYPGDSIGEDEYHSLVEEFSGKCECGGNYSFDAPQRCPNCRSTESEFDPEGGFEMYD